MCCKKTFRSLFLIQRPLTGFLYFGIALSCFSILIMFFVFLSSVTFLGSWASKDLTLWLHLSSLVSDLQQTVFAFSFFGLVVWTYQAVENNWTFRYSRAQSSLHIVAASFFLPVFNFWRPYFLFKELSTGVVASRDQWNKESKIIRTSPGIVQDQEWLFLWMLFLGVVGLCFSVALLNRQVETVIETYFLFGIEVVLQFLYIITSLLFMFYTKRLSFQQWQIRMVEDEQPCTSFPSSFLSRQDPSISNLHKRFYI